MKNIAGSNILQKVILVIISTLLLSSCHNQNDNYSTKSTSTYNFVNTTNIEDKVYNFCRLYEIDTINGFDEYFQDSQKCEIANYMYLLFHGLEGMEDGQITFSDYFNSEVLNEKMETINFFIELYLSTTKTYIYLDQKNKAIMTAWCEGPQNQAQLSLREGYEFDIHWTSAFSNELFEGTYIEKYDTIILLFDSIRPSRVGDTLLLKDGYLKTINYGAENDRYIVAFRVGEFQGLY